MDDDKRARATRATAWLLAVAVTVGAGAGIWAASDTSHRSEQRSEASARQPSPTPSGLSPSAPLSSPSAGATAVTTSVPTVECPTSDGAGSAPPPATAAPTTADVPAAVGDIARYVDTEGRLELFGPAGYRCEALIGADGSARLSIAPAGAASTSASAGGVDTSRAGLEIWTTGGCAGCALSDACPVFLTAAQTDGMPCGGVPTGETRQRIGPQTFAYVDPPSARSPYPTIGRYNYRPGAAVDAFRNIDCRLPDTERTTCEFAVAASHF